MLAQLIETNHSISTSNFPRFVDLSFTVLIVQPRQDVGEEFFLFACFLQVITYFFPPQMHCQLLEKSPLPKEKGEYSMFKRDSSPMMVWSDISSVY